MTLGKVLIHSELQYFSLLPSLSLYLCIYIFIYLYTQIHIHIDVCVYILLNSGPGKYK
jgi:hypothetical protein